MIRICPECRAGAPGTAQTCPACGTGLPPDLPRGGHQLVGMVIEEKYRLDDFLTEGGMGWVYRGQHLRLGSDIAIKLMKPPSHASASVEARFAREARSSSRLNHPHIISVMDFGRTPAGMLFIVSEFIDGRTLTEVMDDDVPFDLHRALRIFSQLLAAVEVAHAHQVVHRDLKPDNVMVLRLSDGDFIKVLDFGIAKLEEESSSELTLAGDLFGTPAYMAPEQIDGRHDVTGQTDLYACGVLLYQLLTGEVPFKGATVRETLSMHLTRPPPAAAGRSRVGELPPIFDSVIQRAMAKAPSERFANVAELRQVLFAGLEADQAQGVPCKMCHRLIRSPLDYCSEHCASHRRRTVAAPPRPAAAREPRTPEVVLLPRQPTAAYEAPAVANAPAADPVVGGAPAPEAAPPLVGRDVELATIAAFLAGDDCVLEVVGPLGSGRSSTLGAAATEGSTRGYHVLRCGADTTLAHTPWSPVQELVAQVLGLEGDATGLGTLRMRALDAGLVAEDISGLMSLFQVPRGDSTLRAAPLFIEKTHSALRALLPPHGDPARRRLYLLDDVSSYDGASMAFVRLLCAAAPGHDVKIIVASDSSVLHMEGLHRSIYLRPLDDESVRGMLRRCDGCTPDDVASIAQRCAGSPLHLDQAMRLLQEGAREVPAGLTEIICQRLARLDAPARQVLEMVSVVGRAAPVDLLRHLSEDAGMVIEAGLHQLGRRGLVNLQRTSQVSVTHPAVASAAYDAMDPELRRSLHAAVLERYERQGEGPIARARHAFEAGPPERALELLEEAGDFALALQDPESAGLTHYRRAQQVARWQLLMGEEDPRYLELSLKLGRALRTSSHYLSAELVLKEAVSAASRRPDLQCVLLVELARLNRARGFLGEALDSLMDATTRASEAGQPELLVEMYLEIGELLVEMDAPDRALTELTEGIQIVTLGEGLRARRGPAGLWRLLARAAELQLDHGHVGLARAHARTALDHARRERDLEGQARCHLLLARFPSAADGPPETERRQNLAAALTLYSRLGDRQKTAECLLLQARDAPERSGDLIARALTLARQVQWEDGVNEATRLSQRR